MRKSSKPTALSGLGTGAGQKTTQKKGESPFQSFAGNGTQQKASLQERMQIHFTQVKLGFDLSAARAIA